MVAGHRADLRLPDPELAYAHARTMVGVDVTACPICDELPPIVRDDIESEYEGEEVTPVDVEEIDDQK